MAYETILTVVGLQKLASATPEQQLKINQIGVGDGDGSYAPLDPEMTGLVNEVWRGPASAPIRDSSDPTVLIFEGIIPANVGGFFIREAAIFDDLGSMIAIGQVAVTEKPVDDLGTALTLTVRFRMKLSNSSETALVYNDSPAIDHSGLTNRDAPNSHPMSAITGLSTALAGKVDKSMFVYAGTGLNGGGALSASVTLSVKYGSAAGTAAEGNDPRLSDSREWTAQTVPQAEAEAGTATTRRAWTAQRVRQAIAAWWNGVSTAFTRTMLGRSTAAQVRSDLELGNAATATLVAASYDPTPGRVVTAGWMGLGHHDTGPNLIADIDDKNMPTCLFHFINDGAAPGTYPEPPLSAGTLMHFCYNRGSIATQVATMVETGRQYVRVLYDGTWGAWQEVYTVGRNATLSQAQAMTSNNVVMTPQRVGDALDRRTLGRGQAWQDLTASRTIGTIYTNTTGRPIYVSVVAYESGTTNWSLEVDGVQLGEVGAWESGSGTFSGVVPNGSTYRVYRTSGTGGEIRNWAELR